MLFIVFHVLELFYSEHCIGCPEARQAVRHFAASRPDVVVIEREVESHLELAKRYRVIATPAVVIDGDAVLYGVPRLAPLAARVDASHPLTHSDQDPR
jgi:alkyl hydroperoxide reductase subunit AhpF